MNESHESNVSYFLKFTVIPIFFCPPSPPTYSGRIYLGGMAALVCVVLNVWPHLDAWQQHYLGLVWLVVQQMGLKHSFQTLVNSFAVRVSKTVIISFVFKCK